jgi:hypothetical protein
LVFYFIFGFFIFLLLFLVFFLSRKGKKTGVKIKKMGFEGNPLRRFTRVKFLASSK